MISIIYPVKSSPQNKLKKTDFESYLHLPLTEVKNDKKFEFTHETLAVISVFPVLTTTSSISFPLSRTDELVHAKLKIACSGFIELLRFDIDRASLIKIIQMNFKRR